MSKSAPWTPSEIQTLCDRYPHDRTADLTASMGRPLRQVYNAEVTGGQKARPVD